MRGIGRLLRTLPLLLVALFCISCIPPTCIDSSFGASGPRYEHLLTLNTYSEPIEEPPSIPISAGIGMSDRFRYGAVTNIDARGHIRVSTLNHWPQRCPDLSQEELVRLSRNWQPIFDQTETPQSVLRFMANPDVEATDWRPDGPLLQLSVGSTKGTTTSGKSIALFWDFHASLPESLEIAVMRTLNVVCSNSRLAKKYLLRDLPPPVASQLECG